MWNRNRRPAFTLIELLVVIAVMIALATIAVAVVPDALNRSKTADGAERLQEWLLISKQRALRDNAPRGLRLIPEVLPNGDVVCRQLEYIEVPDNFAPPGILFVRQARFDPANTNPFQTHEVILRGGGDIRPFVQPGDLLELVETGGVYQIVPIDPANGINLEYPTPNGPPDSTRFMVMPQVEEAKLAPFIAFQNGFQFVRTPKPLMGEDALELPTDIVIWLTRRVDTDGDGVPDTSVPVSLGLPNQQPFDIAFSPGGPVQPARQGRIVLWVRDYPLDERDPAGEPTLITVYSRTGAISAHPVGPAGQEYLYTQDGRNSGL